MRSDKCMITSGKTDFLELSVSIWSWCATPRFRVVPIWLLQCKTLSRRPCAARECNRLDKKRKKKIEAPLADIAGQQIGTRVHNHNHMRASYESHMSADPRALAGTD